jgi:hypothetical protein
MHLKLNMARIAMPATMAAARTRLFLTRTASKSANFSMKPPIFSGCVTRILPVTKALERFLGFRFVVFVFQELPWLRLCRAVIPDSLFLFSFFALLRFAPFPFI